MAWVRVRATARATARAAAAMLASVRVLPAPAGQRATCAHEALIPSGSSTAAPAATCATGVPGDDWIPTPPPVHMPGTHLIHVVVAGAHRWVLASVVELVAVLVSGLLLLAVGAVVTLRAQSRRHARRAARARQVVIIPPAQVEADGAARWWSHANGLLLSRRRRWLHGRAHLVWEYRWRARQLQIVLWVPAGVSARAVAAAVQAAWPGATTEIGPATAPLVLHPPAPRPDQAPRKRSGPDQIAAGPVRGDTVSPGRGSPGRVGRSQAPGGRDAGAAGTQPSSAGQVLGGVLAPVLPSWFPLAMQHDSDPLRAVLAVAGMLNQQESACVQVLARPAAGRQVARQVEGATTLKTGRAARPGLEGLLLGGLRMVLELFVSSPPARPGGRGAQAATPADPVRERQARAGLDKITGPQWEVALRYGLAHLDVRGSAGTPSRGVTEAGWFFQGARSGNGSRTQVHLREVASALVASFAVFTETNRLVAMSVPRPGTVLGGRRLRRGFLLSQGELAALAGLPTDDSVAGLDRARSRTQPAPIAVPAGGRGVKVLGRAVLGAHAVALPVVDSRAHLHVLGSTGVGKSTFLSHLILQDIQAGRGTVLIDPKGDLARDVLQLLPTSALSRLVLIDPDQPGGGGVLNPLEVRPGEDPHLMVDNIVSIFAAIFHRHWGPRMDDVLRVACLTLMRQENPTLLRVAPLLNSRSFRARFTTGLDDPAGLKGFWEWYESTPAHVRAQVIGPVLARLRSFLLRDFVADTMGPARSSFDMAQVLDGGILIARLPKGQLGEDASRLMGSLIFASVWQAATARAARPESRRPEAAIYVDEAHNVLNMSGSVSDMLAEARGYHLSMTLAHQNLDQLPRETQVALSANARNKIYFTCSPEDARSLARHTAPELDEHDLSHLDAFVAAARLVVHNREVAAFNLATTAPAAVGADLAQVRAVIAENSGFSRPTRARSVRRSSQGKV